MAYEFLRNAKQRGLGLVAHFGEREFPQGIEIRQGHLARRVRRSDESNLRRSVAMINGTAVCRPDVPRAKSKWLRRTTGGNVGKY